MSQISELENRYSLFEQGLLDEAQANQLRQDVADAASARDIDLFEDQRTDSGQLYESGKAAARGFLGSFATMGEGLGEAADAITNKLGFEDLIDSGEENELVRMSRAAQESIQEKLGADVAYRDQWLTKFGEGAGSFASFLVPGGGLKLLGAGSKLATGVTAAQAAGVGAGEQAQRIEGAREQGIDVSQEQEDSAILWGSGVGLTELAPVHRVLSRITKAASPEFKKGIANKIKGALVSGGIEGVQEVAASIMQDAVERGVYNEELPFNDSLMDDFTVGGAVGAVADLALTAAAGRSGRKRNRQAEQDLRTAEQDAVEGLSGEVTEGQIQERAGAETALPDFVVEDDATPDDLIDFQKTLDQEMKGAGLSDVKANIHHALRNVLRNNDGNLVFGIRPRREGEQDVRTFGGQSNIVVEEGPQAQEGETIEGIFSDAAGQIFVAADALPKEGTLDEQRDSAVGILKHEQLHAMRAMDLFTDSEWTTLTKAVNQRNKKGTNGTYFDWASNSYDNLSPVELVEEAVAEMTRDLRADNTIVTGKPRTLIQRIIDFFPKLNNFIKGRGYSTFDSLVRDIDSGKVGGRKRGEIRTLKNLEGLGSAVRQPDFDASGAINQEREEDFPAAPKDAASIRKDDTGAERLNFLTQRLAFVRGSLEQDTDMYPATRRKLEREARELSDELRGLDTKDKYSIRKSSTPIESAVDLATTKYADYNTAVEEEFFGEFWPRMMTEVKGTVTRDKVRTASKRAVKDINEFVSRNPKYQDYYDNDQKAVKLALEQEFPDIKQDDLAFYQLANGLSSPATSLPANVGDALNFLSLYKRDGNLDAIEMGLSAKGNPVIAKAPFSVSGTSGPTKARSLKVIDRLIKENSNSPDPVSRAVSFLKEKVTPRELQKFNKSMGYKSAVSDMKAIRSLVKQATGQDEKIPRMFIFGKKVGAYTLNLVGEGNYTTIDVWESRFVRSYFEGLFDKRYGIPKTVDEDVLFQEFSSMFKQEYEKDTGSSVDASTLQAMRWFYIINAAKQSGYRGASTSETISELTERYIGKREAGRVSDAGRTESDGSAAQEVRSEGGDQALQDKFSRRVDNDGLQRDRDGRGIGEVGIYEALPGAPNVKGTTGPIPEIVDIAKSYAERNDIPYRRQPEYVRIDVERSTRIADAYDKMPHDPFNPEVQEAYKDLSRQTIAQYEALVDGGYSFTFFGDNTDPYNGKPWRSLADLRNNKTMAVYSTEAGYGMTPITDQMRAENPLLDITPYIWKDQDGNDKPVMVNDLFRAVHDAFGHGSEYSGFRPRGEENAWVAHSQLFTGPALKALTSETRGQNSWVNFGPHGEQNQTASLEDTVFADQKTGLMPSFTWTDGALPPMERERADGSVVGGDPDIQKVTRDAGAVDKVVKENEEAAETPSVSVPPFSTFADPEAQFVAKNPQDGLKPTSAMKDKFSRRKEPPLSPELSKIIDGIAAEPPPNITPGETYLKNTETSNLQYFLDKSKQSAINKYARLERYSRDPLFKENLADTSAIAAAYFADRSMGITGAALKYGVPVYQNGVTQVKAFYHNGKKYRGLIDVMAPLYQNDYNFSLERLAQSYAIALRAEGQRARGLKTPVPEGQLQEIEAEIAKYKNKDGVPIIKEWYEVWQAFNGKTVEFMKATGIVDDALAQKWLEMSDYVPFYRQAEAEDGEIANIGVSAPVMFKRNMTSSIKLKELKGSEKAVNVPMLDAITRNLSMAIDAGMKNVAQQRIVRDMVKIGIAEKATTAQRKNISQNFVVNFKVKGVDQYYKIHDPLIYESLQSTEEMGGVVTGLFGGASTILREMVTREPGFMFANLMRDTLSAYVTSGADFTPVVDTVAALGKDVEQLESFGVVGGYDFGNDPKDMVKAFSKESRKRGISMDGKGPILNPFTKIWDWAGQGTTLSDAATRRAVYDDVLARTGNEAEAAFQALEVINFSRRGRNPAVRFLTTAIPFLNARFQGLDVLYRGFMGYNPAQKDLTRGQASLTALSRGAIITATTLMYWLMFSDSEEYKEATDEQRDLNWIFPNPFGGRPIRIPVPFEVGLLFKTIPERIFDSYSVAKVFGKTGDTSDRELFESLVQRGIGSTLAVNPLGIQLVGPLLEAAINHNSFTSSPIVPIYVEKNGMDGLLGRESNTQIAKAIGLASNINPIKIDHVLYGYTGTIGAYLIDTIDRLIAKNPEVTGGSSAPPSLSVDQYPVLKRFLISKFSDGDRQDFYRLRAEVEKVTGSLKKLKDAERYDELEAVIRTKGHLAAMSGDIDYISKELTNLRRQREEIERLPVSIMSGKEKQEAMDEIIQEMRYVVDVVSELKRIADLPATSGLPLSDVINILSK